MGTQNGICKSRIIDPTGVFTVYAGPYQPETSLFFLAVQIPAFIALAGKARIYEPEPISFYISIRAEEVNVVDEKIRIRWIIDTTEQTVERLEVFSEALASGYRGEKNTRVLARKRDFLNLAEGISSASNRNTFLRNL